MKIKGIKTKGLKAHFDKLKKKYGKQPYLKGHKGHVKIMFE